MSRINLITAPDRLYNANISILLINPSEAVKADFNKAILNLEKEINLYLYETNQVNDYDWLITICNTVDYVVLDISNSSKEFWLMGYILSLPQTHYLTSINEIPYHLLNNNRIYDFSTLVEKLNKKD